MSTLFVDLPEARSPRARPAAPRRALNAHGEWALDGFMNVVLFAGMGGACDGLEAAGLPIHLAVNHDPIAIAVHKKRHPHTRHLQTDVFEVDPREATGGRPVGVLWASPDCRHFSRAKGGAPVSPRVRSLPWIVCRWAGQARPLVIFGENVSELRTWGPLIAMRDKATGRVLKADGTVAAKGERVPVQQQLLIGDPKRKGKTFRRWTRHLDGLGYPFDCRDKVCADYGVPTTRKRLFWVARRDGHAPAWPEPTHAPRDKAEALGLKPWVSAGTIIQWWRPMRSIFGRKKSLAPKTLRRIARGIVKFVLECASPFIVPVTHGGDARVHDLADPLRTQTTAHRGEFALIATHLSKFRQNSVGTDLAEPLPTYTASSFIKRPGGAAPLAVVAASLVQTGYGERPGQTPRALDPAQPFGTMVAGGSKVGVVASFLEQYEPDAIAAWMVQHNGGDREMVGRHLEDPVTTTTTRGPHQAIGAAALIKLHGTSSAHDAAEPAATFTSSGNHIGLCAAFLEKYYGTGGQDQAAGEPLHTLSTKARFGVVTVQIDGETYALADILMRMLEPEEGAAAHGFPDGALPAEIEIDGEIRRLTKEQRMALVGNSVPPEMARILAVVNSVFTLGTPMVAAE